MRKRGRTEGRNGPRPRAPFTRCAFIVPQQNRRGESRGSSKGLAVWGRVGVRADDVLRRGRRGWLRGTGRPERRPGAAGRPHRFGAGRWTRSTPPPPASAREGGRGPGRGGGRATTTAVDSSCLRPGRAHEGGDNPRKGEAAPHTLGVRRRASSMPSRSSTAARRAIPRVRRAVPLFFVPRARRSARSTAAESGLVVRAGCDVAPNRTPSWRTSARRCRRARCEPR